MNVVYDIMEKVRSALATRRTFSPAAMIRHGHNVQTFLCQPSVTIVTVGDRAYYHDIRSAGDGELFVVLLAVVTRDTERREAPPQVRILVYEGHKRNPLRWKCSLCSPEEVLANQPTPQEQSELLELTVSQDEGRPEDWERRVEEQAIRRETAQAILNQQDKLHIRIIPLTTSN